MSLSEIIGSGAKQAWDVIDTYDDIPHMLFHGPPGSGKTTTAKKISRELSGTVTLFNTSKHSRVEDIRKVIEPASQNHSIMGGTKVVILDEFEFMSDNAQASMRAILDETGAIFILTCNDRSKIFQAIDSRVLDIKFPYPEKDDRVDYLVGNGVPKDIAETVAYEHTDMRRIKMHPDIVEYF